MIHISSCPGPERKGELGLRRYGQAIRNPRARPAGLPTATSRDGIRYIYSTFPIVAAQETAKWGSYRSQDLCLAWINALMAGQPDAEIEG